VPAASHGSTTSGHGNSVKASVKGSVQCTTPSILQLTWLLRKLHAAVHAVDGAAQPWSAARAAARQQHWRHNGCSSQCIACTGAATAAACFKHLVRLQAPGHREHRLEHCCSREDGTSSDNVVLKKTQRRDTQRRLEPAAIMHMLKFRLKDTLVLQSSKFECWLPSVSRPESRDVLTFVLTHHACVAGTPTAGSCAVAAATAAPAATAAVCLLQPDSAPLAQLHCKATLNENYSQPVWLNPDQQACKRRHWAYKGVQGRARSDQAAGDRAPVKTLCALTPLMPKEDAPAARPLAL
jgi:hypothetical protein